MELPWGGERKKSKIEGTDSRLMQKSSSSLYRPKTKKAEEVFGQPSARATSISMAVSNSRALEAHDLGDYEIDFEPTA